MMMVSVAWSGDTFIGPRFLQIPQNTHTVSFPARNVNPPKTRNEVQSLDPDQGL